MENEMVFTFSGTNSAIQAENVLLAAGLPVKVMPLPACISAGCGICLRLSLQNGERARAVLRKNGISQQQIYTRSVNNENGRSTYEVWEESENGR